MKLAFVITGAPYSTQAPQSAWHTATAALEQGQTLSCIFLYGDGAHLANSLSVIPPNEPDWAQRWSALVTEQALPSIACIGSALRRGILDETEARRYGKPAANLAQGWQLAGLGEWVQAQLDADRILYFNGPD